MGPEVANPELSSGSDLKTCTENLTSKSATKTPKFDAKTPKSDVKTPNKPNTKAQTPKSDSKPVPKANPLAKFLVKMKPGALPAKPKEYLDVDDFLNFF